MQRWIAVFSLIILYFPLSRAEIGHAKQVMSYQPGSDVTLTQASAALGLPEGLVGEGTPFVSVLSPFNPPYESSQILQIGPGGELTLKLSHFAIVGPGREFGLFSNVGIFDAAYPSGQAGDPISLFGQDKVFVEVSEDGVTYHSLGEKNINMFHNVYTDLDNPYSPTPGGQRADFGKPFLGQATDFIDKNYAEIKQILAGSAGGNWFDVGALPISKFAYVRFSLPANATKKFELDSVTINQNLLGALVDGENTLANKKRTKLKILRPLSNETVPAQFMAIGTVKSSNKIVGIEYNINHGPWQEATLVDQNWSALVEVPEGLTAIQLEVRSFDDQAQRSKSKFRLLKIAR